MYFNYIFLLTDFYKNDFIPDSFESSAFIVPVNQQLREAKRHYTQKLNSATFTFCLGFFNADMDWWKAELSPILDSISLFFFLPNYIKKGGAYLLVSDLETGMAKKQLNDIETLLKAQGIAPLAKNYTTGENRIHQFNKYFYYSDDLIAAFNNAPSSIDFSVLFKAMVAENGIDKQIVVPVKDEDDFKRKKSVIADFEKWLLNNEKAYVDLLSVFKKTNDAYLKLEIDNKKLRFRIDNYNDYLKLLREMAILHVNEFQRIQHEQQITMKRYGSSISANAITPSSKIYDSNKELEKEMEFLKSNRDTIRDWYEKEYEVLPLWYKRFGHVLKVMTGKRSFKSLYK